MKPQTKTQILLAVEKFGLKALTCLLRGLIRGLYRPDKRWDLRLRVRHLTQWETVRAKYNEGVDLALRENLIPGEAVDRLAKKAGISKEVIRATSRQNTDLPLKWE